MKNYHFYALFRSYFTSFHTFMTCLFAKGDRVSFPMAVIRLASIVSWAWVDVLPSLHFLPPLRNGTLITALSTFPIRQSCIRAYLAIWSSLFHNISVSLTLLRLPRCKRWLESLSHPWLIAKSIGMGFLFWKANYLASFCTACD